MGSFTQSDAEQLESLFQKFYATAGDKFGSFVSIVVASSSFNGTGLTFGVSSPGLDFKTHETAWGAIGGFLNSDPDEAKRQKIRKMEAEVEVLKAQVRKEGGVS